MQVKALYNHGKIEFLEDVEVKHERFHVVVDLPDEELVDLLPKTPECIGIREEIDGILGKYASAFKGGDSIDAKGEWRVHLERKYLK